MALKFYQDLGINVTELLQNLINNFRLKKNRKTSLQNTNKCKYTQVNIKINVTQMLK